MKMMMMIRDGTEKRKNFHTVFIVDTRLDPSTAKTNYNVATEQDMG